MGDLGPGPFEATARGVLCQRAWRSIAPSAVEGFTFVSSTLDMGFLFPGTCPPSTGFYLFIFCEARRTVGYSILLSLSRRNFSHLCFVNTNLG